MPRYRAVRARSLGQFVSARNREQRRHLAVASRRDDAIDEAQVALHRARRAEPVQRLNHEVGVAQPAVAVVPVAPAVGALGDRGRQRREHGARVFVRAELQRDRRADHGVLPIEWNRKTAHPVLPVLARVLEERGASVCGGFLDRLVGAENERHRRVDDERRLVGDGAQRRIRRHAKAGGPGVVGEVMRAASHARRLAPYSSEAADERARPACRRAARSDARSSSAGTCGSRARNRGQKSTMRRRLPFASAKHRLDDRGVAHVALPLVDAVDESIANTPRSSGLAVAVDQRAENRIAVEPRQAA